MNNLAYISQQPDKVAPQVEEKLRKETGASAPILYKVEDQGGTTSVSSVLSDVARGLFGGRSELLFTLVFEMTEPRRAELRAAVARQGVGCHVGTLLYSIQLAKPVKSEVTLEPPKSFGMAKFTGDAEALAKLNAKGDLLKRIAKFARTESELGGLKIKIERWVKLLPQDNGALLVISTLGRPTSMGLDASLDAKEFFDIAAQIESLL